MASALLPGRSSETDPFLVKAPAEGEADSVKVATIWVEKAMVGRSAWTSSCSEAQVEAHRLRKQLKPLTLLVKYGLLALAVVEVPSYCLQDHTKCPSNHPEMHGSKMVVLPHSVTNTLAIVFWCYLAWYQWLRRKSMGAAFHMTRWHQAGYIFLALALLDSFSAVIDGRGLLWFSSFRLSRLMRPFVVLCFTHSLRTEATRILTSLPKYADVFVALAATIFFYAWVGLILFTESSEGSQMFGTWSNSIANLYILFTTANCPDIFLHAYETNRLYFIFFFSFLVVTLYLLANLLMAGVYESYKDELKGMVKRHAANQQKALSTAFSLLADERGVISRQTWSRFFLHLCDPTLSGGGLELSNDNEYNAQRAQKIFYALDKDHSDGLDMSEFRMVLDVLHHSETYIPRKAPPRLTGGSYREIFTKGIFVGGQKIIGWEALMDMVISVDVSIVFFQTLLFVNGGGSFKTEVLDVRHPWYWTLLAFSVFYVLTVTAKIMALGFERFWYSNPVQHRFDFFNVYLCFAAEVVCFYLELTGQGAGEWSKIALLMHVARGLRLVHYIKPLKQLGHLMVRLAGTYFRVGMLMVMVYYVYTMLGQQLFGGAISEANEALKGSGFAEANYWSMNFNDFNSGMVTLFVIMVINNWTVLTGGYILATGTKWASAFFVSFFFVVNLVVLNILLALILDCSGTVKEELEKQQALEDKAADRDDGLEAAKVEVYDYETMLRRLLLEEGEDASPVPEKASLSQQSAGGYGSTDEVKRMGSV